MAPHHGLHHIGLVVPKRFGSKENIHQAVTADHLQDRGTGTEGATAATPVSKGNKNGSGSDLGTKDEGRSERGNQKAGSRSERPKGKVTLKSHGGWTRRDEKWSSEASPRIRRLKREFRAENGTQSCRHVRRYPQKGSARRLEKRSRYVSRESDREGKKGQRQTSPGARWEDQPGPAMETHSQTQALSSACGHQGSSPPFVPVPVTEHEPSGKWETNHPCPPAATGISH